MRRIAYLLLACIPLLGLPVTAKTWEQAITDVEALAADYRERHRALGFDGVLGTAYNEVDVQMHHCAILGRMVGHKDAISHLEPPQPGSGATARELAIAANSLENWLIAARYHATLSPDQKRRIWNLDCVGKYRIPSDRGVSVPDGFDVRYDAERKSIYVQGDVTSGFAAVVIGAMKRYPEAETIGFGSGGGAVYEAIEAGRAIRRHGLSTELLNDCYSACPLVVFGGVARFMWWPHNEMGFHQVSRNGTAVPLDDRVYADIAGYVTEMGGDWQMVLRMMLSAAPHDMYIASEEERCASKVITGHQRGCIVLD